MIITLEERKMLTLLKVPEKAMKRTCKKIWYYKYKRCHYSTTIWSNLKLKERLSCLEDKVVQLEIKNYNLEIQVIPTTISDYEVERTAVSILNSINIDLDSSKVETCPRNGKSKGGKPKKTITRIVNRKFCKKALLSRILIKSW